MIELIFATNNAHKLEEVQAIVGKKFLLNLWLILIAMKIFLKQVLLS
ncbi:hypothetical protein [Sphingobacterium sp. IITKGP-BTPF85]|nr:hypothetical protein [Sphingobacterium sp. IITKGP-BTPF85]KKX46383.1 hypothetical protein L950_0232380 [Sphingobacterium sp. IITKGP-BTPF85]